ncbi:MAG: hypothetical protein PHU74_03395 [Candidatus Pacebacteria bacterium]|nr:hypothetical protein [Candidatus Paceibacterota bacterium]
MGDETGVSFTSFYEKGGVKKDLPINKTRQDYLEIKKTRKELFVMLGQYSRSL